MTFEAITKQLQETFDQEVEGLTKAAQAIEETRLEMLERHATERASLIETQQAELAAIKQGDDFAELQKIHENCKNLAEMLGTSNIKVSIPTLPILGARNRRKRSVSGTQYGKKLVMEALAKFPNGASVGELTQFLVDDDADAATKKDARSKVSNTLYYGKDDVFESTKGADGHHVTWSLKENATV